MLSHNSSGPNGKAPPAAPPASLALPALPALTQHATRSTIAARAPLGHTGAGGFSHLPKMFGEDGELIAPPLLLGKLPSPPPLTIAQEVQQVASGAGLLSPDFPPPPKPTRMHRPQATN